MSAKKKDTTPDRFAWAKALLRWVSNDAPVFAIVAISFTGSYFHIIELAERHGQHGVEAMATAGVVDLFCYVMAMERQRDKSIGRGPKGPFSLPAAFLVLGVFATLAINLATASPPTPATGAIRRASVHAGHAVNVASPGAWGYVIAAIPPAGLILAIFILERRKTFTPAEEEKGERRRNPRQFRNPGSAPGSGWVPAADPAAGSGAGSGAAPLPVPSPGTQGPPPARRSVEQLAAEGSAAEARMGQKLSVKKLRLTLACKYEDARAAARLMHPEDYADADEESEAEGQ